MLECDNHVATILLNLKPKKETMRHSYHIK